MSAAESVTLTGTYRRMAKEVVLGGTASHAYDDLLVTPSRTYRLRLRGAPPVSGSTVRVSARTTGTGAFEVTGTTTLREAPSRATLGATSTLAILVHWGSPDSLTQASAQSRLFGDANTWLKEVSYGQTSLTGTVTPWLRITAPTSGRCYDYADQIMSRARNAASAAGYRWDDYHRTLVYFPRCTGSDSANLTGWAFEPGDSIWLNGVMDRRTSVHEHGHSFGIGHARSYACADHAGARVTLSDDCTVAEYGDPYDAMGNSAYAGHYTGYHKNQVGWLGGTRKHVMTTPAATFTLPPFERPSTLPVAVAANGGEAGRRYWLEYRQPVGMDAKFPAGATGGVMVHLEDRYRLGTGSYLLDLSPSDGTFNNVTLGPGRSWTSPDGVRIAVNSVSTSGATVTVSGARPEPTVPSAPRGLTVRAGHGRALLTWEEPAFDGNAPRRRYVVSTGTGASYSVPGDVHSYLVTGLQNGTRYTVSVEAHNDAGAGPPVSAYATPVASTTPPAVRITSPVDGSTVTGSVTVRATVEPDGLLTALDTKRWYVDGAYVTAGTAFEWNTLSLPNGRHTVMAVGYDELDRPGNTEAVFDVQNLKPTVALTSPAPGARVTGGYVAVTADAGPSEDGTPVHRVELYNGTTLLATDFSAPYEFQWSVTSVNGAARLVPRAVDTLGRWATGTGVDVTVYHDPPSVRITSPAPDTTHRGTSLTVAADATPATPGVPISYVTFSGTFGYVTDYTAPYGAQFDTSGFTGTGTVYAHVVDVTGRSRNDSRSVVVANALPSVAFTAPQQMETLRTKTVTFSGTVARPSSGNTVQVALTVPGRTLLPTVAADGTWTATWDATGVYGRQQVTAKVRDSQGYWASATRELTLERPAPVVAFTPPPAGTAGTTGTIALRAVVEMPEDAVRSVTAVCFWDGGARLGCGQLEPDGRTWVARDARASSPGHRWFSVAVYESDGHYSYRGGAYVDVSAPPLAPYSPSVATGYDGTVSLGWASWTNDGYQPVDEFLVRDRTGAVVARSPHSPVVFRPPLLGESQQFSVEARNAWGTSERAYSDWVTPVWQTAIAPVVYTRTATTYPGTVTVTARLVRYDGQPVAGHRLTVSGPANDGTWRHWFTPPTSSSGYTTVTFTPASTMSLVVAHQAEGGYEYAVSDPVSVTVRALVTGNLRSGRMALGATTYFDGAVQPPRPRRFVYLQRYYAGAWRTVTYRAQDASGRVSVPIKPGARGTYQYRLYYGGDPALVTNVSPARTLYVV